MTCQSCGKKIELGGRVVRIQVGLLAFTAHPHAKVVSRTADDYFHATCDSAIRAVPA